MGDPEVWTFAGVVITAVLLFLGTWITVAQGRKAQRAASQLQKDEGAFQRLEKLTDRFEKRMNELESRVTSLEEQLSVARRDVRSAVAYIQRLLDFIADHLPGHPSVPEPPATIDRYLGDDWRIVPPTEEDQ